MQKHTVVVLLILLILLYIVKGLKNPVKLRVWRVRLWTDLPPYVDRFTTVCG